MPTGFDDFTTKAYADSPNASKKEIANRELLKSVMSKNGFTVYKEEWWHYDFNNWKDYDLTDISFEELYRLQVSQ
ncbi:D-alanyl-D-alanine dipeptidase [compost metagenome]